MPLRQHGFTLLESMIVIAIMAILVSVALPSLVDAQNSNRVDSVQRDLLSVMNQGRTQAVNEGDRISLCGSSYGLHCDNDWIGWALFQVSSNSIGTTSVKHQPSGTLIPGNCTSRLGGDCSNSELAGLDHGGVVMPLTARAYYLSTNTSRA